MAIDKKKASPVVKIGIIAVSVMLVVGFTIPLIGTSVFSGGDDTTATDPGSGQLDAIAANYGPTIQTFEGQLASDPTSYTVLVNLGNTYFDWALDIQQVPGATEGGYDRPQWISSASYYERAVAQQAGDPAVATDMSVAIYYSGDASGAIAVIEPVIEESPDFPAAWFNAGIFYSSVGANEQATAALNQYLELDPEGTVGNADYARQLLTDLESGTTTE